MIVVVNIFIAQSTARICEHISDDGVAAALAIDVLSFVAGETNHLTEIINWHTEAENCI